MHAGQRRAVERLAAAAREAARRAGEVALGRFRGGADIRAHFPHDVKLATDRLCEEAVIETIRARFPDHAVLSEESGEIPGDGGYLWVVDPLDGTLNFLQGLPFFCTSVACCRRHGGDPPLPVAAAVFLPYSDEMFTAVSGRGAERNGLPLPRRRRRRSAAAVVSLSFGKTRPAMRRMLGRLERLLPRVRKVRCLGAVAAELAYIAAGHLDGLVYEGIRLWDFAAGRLLVEDTGGFFRWRRTAPEEWQVAAGVPGLQAALSPGTAARAAPSSLYRRRPVTR